MATSQSSSYLTDQQHLTRCLSSKHILYLSLKTPHSPGFVFLFLLISVCWFPPHWSASKYWSVPRNSLWTSFLTTFTLVDLILFPKFNYNLYWNTVVSSFLWFHFPWFQLPLVNWDLEADDPLSDGLSKGQK